MTAALLFPPQTRNRDLSCNETLQPLRPIVVDIRLGHKNFVNKLRAAISQSFTNRSWHLAVCLRPWMQHLGDSIAFRIKRLVLGPIVKTETIDVVDKGFCRGVLGEDQGMVLQFNMEVREYLRGLSFSDNRDAVYQRAGLNEDVVNKKSMIGRYNQVP